MKLYATFLLFFMILSRFALSQTGWRPGEMEIRINVTDETTGKILTMLHLDGEYYKDFAILYVTGDELKKLEQAGIPYEITVNDMNQHYAGFWSNRDAYHTYQQIINLADSLMENFPAICRKVNFGYSLQERQLVALKISDNVAVDEPEAEVMFDGGIHGDEIIGPEIVIRFARDLCLDYEQDPYITDLIDNREIWLYLMVNPDGRANMTRENANGVDINRDWGYMWDAWGGSSGPYSQIETRALRSCMYNNQFVVHTTYHAGTEYLSYPWSYRSQPSPDNDHVDHLAGIYVSTSLYPNLPYGQGNTGMYAINGSTKDGNYGTMGSVSWSMEISNDKQPQASQIMLYYNRNKPAMEAIIEHAGYGIEGTVTDVVTGEPVPAILFINNYFQTYADPAVGDFHKYLLPGIYDLKVVANDYETYLIHNITVIQNASTVVDIQLQPSEGHFIYKIVSCQIPGNNESDEGYTPAVFGAPDNVNYSIGKNGWILLDMQEPILDEEGADFIVYEGDTSPETYSCYAGPNIDGPWTFLAEGEGTTSFDLASGMVAEAQYIKIVDDGDGSALAADAGFDLDAIQAMDQISGVYLVMVGCQVADQEGNNNGRIDPGETCDLVFTVRNNGNALASNTISAIISASPFISFDPESLSLGDLANGETSEATFSIICSDLTPPGYVMHALLELQANNGGYMNEIPLTLPVGEIAETWETGDFSQFEWKHSTPSPWFITSQGAYEGLYCAHSGPINDNQITGLSLTMDVSANGTISFFKKVSSESGYDFFEFHIDDALQQKWSGEEGWGEVSFPVNTGHHTFQWIYSKDLYSTGGSDCAWIDYIVLPPHPLAGSTYQGTVTDCASGTGLSPVQLTFTNLESGNSTSTSTELTGNYIASLEVGSMVISANMEGYETFCDTVVVYGNEVIIYDLCLNGATDVPLDPTHDAQHFRFYPNPFTSEIAFSFTTGPLKNAQLELYDTKGVRIKYAHLTMGQGTATFKWNGLDESGDRVANGIYFFRLQIGSDLYSGKIIYQLK